LQHLDAGPYIAKKMEKRVDGCIKYIMWVMVAGCITCIMLVVMAARS